MVDHACSPESVTDLRRRVLVLTQQWLPVLLLRVGVSKLEAEKLREIGDMDQLEADLAQACSAVKTRACVHGERPQMVQDALETIASLVRALEIAESDSAHSRALINEVDRRWLQLVLFGGRSVQREISSGAGGTELGRLGEGTRSSVRQ